MTCPFCNQKNILKHKIFQTKTEYVLYNIRKSNKGRCLVIPKRHISTIREFKVKELESLLETVNYVSKKLKKYLKPDGFNYGFNEGKEAGQEVDHFHFHILPRFKNDNNLHPNFHIFHSNLNQKKNWPDNKFKVLVEEFREVLKK